MQTSLSSWMRGVAASAGVAFAVAMAPAVAHATVDANGTFNVNVNGTISVNAGTLTNPTYGVLGPADTILNVAGPFVSTAATAVAPGPLTLTNVVSSGPASINGSLTTASLVVPSGIVTLGTPLTVLVGGYTFSFTEVETVLATTSGSFSSGALDLLWNGTLTGDTSNAVTLGSTAQMAINLSQATNTSSISGAFNIEAPLQQPIPPVPEPASIVLLGSGLLGLGLIRFKRA